MADVSTLSPVELGVLGPLQVRQDGAPVGVPGAKPRAILTMLGLHSGSVVPAQTLVELLWGEDPPRTAAKALQTHISSLRRALGDGFVLTQGAGWTLAESEVDASRFKSAARMGREAATAGDTSQAVARFEEALALWRGIPELPDGRRGTSEKTRWIEGHAALVEDRADALLATGRAAEIIGELEATVADAPLRERRWGQLMLALYRAGRQGEALGAYQRARALLADELGVDPGPELRRLEAAIVAQDAALEIPATQQLSSVTRAVTFLLTDIEGSTAAWEADADAMAVALARHDELVEQVVTSRGGRLVKTRGEGDATFSVFERPSAAAAAAIDLQEAIAHEPWALREPMRIRVALHTGEVELRDGDYFGRAVNRVARLRSLAEGGQILCSGATAELVIDSLPDDVLLIDLGMRQLRNLARPEHVFELRLQTAEDDRAPQAGDSPIERPGLPAVLTGGPGPFVGRGRELESLLSAWQSALGGGTNAVLIAGEPGVGKTRLAGEWSRQAYEQGALVIYGRCDEDLGAPYQPFAEALRALVPCLGADRLRRLRGVEALLPLVPGLTEIVPELAPPASADPDTERYALFDAVVALLGIASAGAPVILILDDLHWAAKPTLLLLRHLLRFGEQARVQIIGTYRSTDLDRAHPLAAMLADLHRDGSANRIQLSGLDEDDVTVYVAEAGYHDEELARALASVTGGNPFFLIEALRHVDESGGRWDQSTLPQGVREAVSRRLTRLLPETNKALAAAAVVGSRFALELVERVVGDDLVDAFDEASKAGIVIEEPGGRYRFNHALVRQSLLAELPSVRRMRLHQRIATTLENEPGADDELLAELAHHYFECAWAGNAVKAVEYCRRAADQAMARLAYEGAADLYDHALHALEELDDELPDRDDQAAELLVARCEALLAAGDVASAAGAVSELQGATVDSARLAAWATCFDGQLSMLTHPGRLDEIETALGAAAAKLAELDDAAGEAKAHTVRAGCLARLGRIGDCEVALDDALTAARRARENRRVNNVLANAPLAALWGPNPVPRAGGRCLDVVRLLRITTDSPAVEATSTRCQAVLEAFRGRAAAARRMIDSARRTVTELGLRHALLEVEQFAGIVEIVADDPAAAEPHLRQAYTGFRRMGLDADTAETAALLGRVCLALDRDAEADELCTESERLAGHALKPAIAWRTLRAQLLARQGDHGQARRIAEAAVNLAEHTDALVDHGDACLALATVLGMAGDTAGARAAAERAAGLYEAKGAAALAEKARGILGTADLPQPPQPEAAPVEPTNACVQAGSRLVDAVNREAWHEVTQLLAPSVSVESRRKIVGFARMDVPSSQWPQDMRRYLETGMVRYRQTAVAVRGDRFALFRLELGTADLSSGAPRDEMLQVIGTDGEGRIALQVKFDVEDIDAAIAELDATHARFEQEVHREERRLENAASQAGDRFLANFAAGDWDAIAEMLADNMSTDDRRRLVSSGVFDGRDAQMANARAIAELWSTNLTSHVIATRGGNLGLARLTFWGRDEGADAFITEVLIIDEVDAEGRISAIVVFDPDDFDAAIAELDARYLVGEAAEYARAWSVIADSYAALNRREPPLTTPDCVNIDHRSETAFGPGDIAEYGRAGLELDQGITVYVEEVQRLSSCGAVVTYAAHETSTEGLQAEWRGLAVFTVDDDLVNRCEIFDEADLDAAITRFARLQSKARGLENAASRVYEHFWTCFAARDWVAMTEIFTNDSFSDDRRRVVNAGIRLGRDAFIADMRAVAEVGTADNTTSTVLATRGKRLTLNRIRSSVLQTELFNVVELNADERTIASVVVFDVDDFDSAIAELDARYLAGQAADYARTWSVITGAFAAHNRREVAPATPDAVSIDHRRAAAFAPGQGIEYIRAGWELDQELNIYIETAHRVNDRGAVFTWAGYGTSHEGFEAEWRGVNLMTVDGEMVDRSEVYEEADLDAAVARFDEISPPTTRLANTASKVAERFLGLFAARDWDAIAETFADNFFNDDRRRVVASEPRHGRDAEMADLRAIAEVGITNVGSTPIATRGDRLVLTRGRLSFRDHETEAFFLESFAVVEIDGHERITALINFELDDFDVAMAELDARYLAGEAAAHSHTWSVVAQACGSITRHELPPTTPHWVNIDHRRGIAFEPGDLTAYIRAMWDHEQNIKTYIESVRQLNELGVVFVQVLKGTSQEGFDAEWRIVELMTVEGGLINRAEFFDEADAAAAIARLEQLSQPTPRLKNAAVRAAERLVACFVARAWDSTPETLADDFYYEDRRRVVGAGIRQGRHPYIEDMRTAADLWTVDVSAVMATRGGRLALARLRFSARDQGPEAFVTDVLGIVEIDADERIVAIVQFDPEDFKSASAELETRYLGGEAAAYAGTWSVVMGGYAGLNRRELPPTTPDWVSIDHRRGVSFAPGELPALLALWDLASDVSSSVEAVHRLNDYGAAVTSVSHETSQEGVNAEWRSISVLAVEGGLISRLEVFDEEEIDAALARFEQLSKPAPRLENAASQVAERFSVHFATRDWDVMAALLADDVLSDDRRRVVGGGSRRGRDALMAEISAVVGIGVERLTSETIATRGGHLALSRVRTFGRDRRPEAFGTDAFQVLQIDADERILARIVFDLDGINAAFEELDARYLAGEAAAHSRTWSVIASAYAAFNRHELAEANWVNIDHRRGTPFASSEMAANLRTFWDLTPDFSSHVEIVHALSNFGAVLTHKAHGTSQEGFDAEWRMVVILTVDDDRINRCEIFDEADLDAAIARFEELHLLVPRLENAASLVDERLVAYFNARDWDSMTEMLADDWYSDDRRPMVNVGVRHGRDVAVANMRASADLGIVFAASRPIATRGERLVLSRSRWSGPDQRAEAFHTDVLSILEINADDRLGAHVMFGVDDIDAATIELDARYLDGEAAPYRRTWSVISRAYAALNRRALPATTPDWTSIDNRPFGTIERNTLTPNIRAFWDLTSEARIDIETVHRLTNTGAVVTHATHATSQEGLEIESREIIILIVEGDIISRCEIFGEADLDGALARLEELQPHPRRLENTASKVTQRFLACFAAGDWNTIAEMLAEDFCQDDRRRVVGAGVRHGRDAEIVDLRAIADSVLTELTSTVLATRGQRLVLLRCRFAFRGQGPDAYLAELLGVGEINADERLVAAIAFDPGDIDAAFTELETRYLAGEAAPYARVWRLGMDTIAELNRHQRGPMTGRFVYADHRRVPFASGEEFGRGVEELWRLVPDARYRVKAVHALDTHGNVVTMVIEGTDIHGSELQWGRIILFACDEPRVEVYEEDDLDAAVARFEELRPQAPQLENAASRVVARFWTCLATRDWAAMAKMMTDNYFTHDHRRVVNAGVLHGRNAHIADMQAVAEVGFEGLASTVVATRGEHLALIRIRSSVHGFEPGEISAEMLGVIEIDSDNRLTSSAVFDSQDIDAAFDELETRYLAGEATAYARTWSAVTQVQAAYNRHELPLATDDCVGIDHRRSRAFTPGDLIPFLRATWDVASDVKGRLEEVHRLNNHGAVITEVVTGTSQEGFEFELREIGLFVFEGDLTCRFELYDEADLDAALAHFDELRPRAKQLENAASRIWERFQARLAADDWVAMAAMTAEDIVTDDRRRVVGAGVQRGRDVNFASLRASAGIGLQNVTSTVIATRGERLVLDRVLFPGRDQAPEPFHTEILRVVEIDAEERIVAGVFFDPDDINGASRELTERWIASGDVPQPELILFAQRLIETTNRHDWDAYTTLAAGATHVNHRQLGNPEVRTIADHMSSIRTLTSLVPDCWLEPAEILAQSALGLVGLGVIKGTSTDGAAIEIQLIQLILVEGERVTHVEDFDADQRDLALARFDELTGTDQPK